MNCRKFICILAAACIAASALADNSKYVNPFLGSAGDHGQVTPAAQLPLGLASVCPDSEPGQHGGYDYDVPAISGISVTRMSGVGGNGTGGNLRVRPALPDEKLEIVKGSERAEPGFYAAALSNGVRVALTATRNIAFERYLFPREGEKVLFVDFNSAIDAHRSECSYNVLDANNIEGWCKTSTTCNYGVYKLYFRFWCSEEFEVVASDSTTALLRFPENVRSVELRIALSPIDEASAARELSIENGRSFKAVRRRAASAWDGVLDRVEVSGSTDEQRVLFYTGMYRVFLSPFYAMSFDGRYAATDGSIRTTEPGEVYFSGWSMWDTFRTKFPMFCVLAPREMEDMCRSLVSLYCTGKKNWATMQEGVPTVRTEHTQITLLDAWSKGIRGFDMAPAFPAMEKEYEAGLQPGSKQGLTRNSPDQKMETIYDLWAMSRIAGIIGNKEAEAKYGALSEELFEQTWPSEFMTITDNFAQMRGNGMYQGTRWQYRWALPVYADRMKELVGSETLASQLSEFFARHLFNQGNEPDIQTPFMFNLFGHPERTDSLVHALITDPEMVHLYGGNAEYPEPFVGRAFQDKTDGYAPEMDEDDGTMSAWYMFCQMGFYPLCVGTDEYELFTPLFTRIKISLPDCTLTIRRRCGEASARSVSLNGRPLEGWTVKHSDLFSGHNHLVFD